MAKIRRLSELKILQCEELHLDELYNSGLTLEELNTQYHISTETIRAFLDYKNTPRRKAKRRESLREVPPVGKKFGLWTVVSDKVKVDSRRNLCWMCKCECGEIQWKQRKALFNGMNKGCKRCKTKKFISENGEVNVNTVLISKYNQIKLSLKDRHKVGSLPFTITPEDLQELYENSNHKCALSSLDLTIDIAKSMQQQNLSIDRIDSNRGYEPDNILLVDKRINMMKQSLSQEEFIELCCKVAEQNGYIKYNNYEKSNS